MWPRKHVGRQVSATLSLFHYEPETIDGPPLPPLPGSLSKIDLGTSRQSIKPIRLIICDRHRLFRQGLEHWLGREPDLKVVGEAATGQQALTAVHRHCPDIVLLDSELPPVGDGEVMRKFVTHPASPNVIVISGHIDLLHLLAAARAGVAAYLPKDAGLQELAVTIRQVAAQTTCLTLEEIHHLHMIYGQRQKQLPIVDPPRLTARQLTLLKLLARGISNHDIASVLKLQEKTVRNRLTELFKRLGVTNRTEAVVYAVRQQLVEWSHDHLDP